MRVKVINSSFRLLQVIGTGISFNIAALIRLSSGSQCGNLTQSGPEGAHFVRYVGSKHQLAPDTELVACWTGAAAPCLGPWWTSGTLAIQGDTVCHPEGQESASTLEGEVNFAFGIPLDKDGYLISGVSHFQDQN